MGFNRHYSDHQCLQMRTDRTPAGVLTSAHHVAACLTAARIGCMHHAARRTASRARDVVMAVELHALENAPVRALVSGSTSFAAENDEGALPEAPDAAQRRGREITQLALLLLGAERAATFLEAPNDHLEARPIELAISSPQGRDRVEAELGRLISHPAR